MALVSSGARHSCEDHLRYPRPVSAARLKSLAFIQAQNENASNSSVLPTTSSFIFSLLSLSPDFFHPFAKAGVFLCLVPLHLAHFFCLCSLRGICPTLFNSLCLAFTTAFFFSFFCSPPLFPKPLFPTLRREEQNLWRVSSARTHFLCLNVRESFFFTTFFCHLFPSVSRQQSKPGQAVLWWWHEKKTSELHVVKHWIF